MYLTTIEVENWLPFKGVQRIDLEATCYAVVAEVDGEEGRSNWSGKTSFLEAIPFALFGLHRKRTEDEWIFDKATSGGVHLHFSNGVVVSRTRKRGNATELVVDDNDTIHTGVEAQGFIERMLAMSRDDFLNTSYFRQKDIARIVYAKPAERAKEFASWFRLGMLRKAEATTLARLNALRGEVDKLNEHLAGLTLGMAQALGEDKPDLAGKTVSEYLALGWTRLQSKRDRAKEYADQKRVAHNATLEAYSGVKAEAEAWQGHFANVERYRAIVAERKGLGVADAAGAATTATRIAAEAAKAQEAKATAENEVRRAHDLLVGEFDGVCPVNRMQCPASEQILAAEKLNRKRYDNAVEASRKAGEESRHLNGKLVEANAEARRQRNIEKRRAELDTIAAECKPSLIYINTHPEAPSIDHLKREKEAAYEVFADADRNHRNLAELVEDWKPGTAEAAKAEQRLLEIEQEMSVLQAAAVVLGRQGAQRVIAERVLQGIVLSGNAKLHDCMIDLEFNITWAREGKGLSDVCTSCGFPLPASQRVKRCPRCDAERGNKTIDKSDILFSDRSGAAEDIIGGVIRLEAGSWFKRDRGSQWGVLLIDEPFGALDEANRDAFTRLLLSACTLDQGNPQAFVVAHHNDVMSTMPAMIRVQRHEGYSTVTAIGEEALNEE
jgi:DNA repair exonuclease SbcCD ATPase subunit